MDDLGIFDDLDDSIVSLEQSADAFVGEFIYFHVEINYELK